MNSLLCNHVSKKGIILSMTKIIQKRFCFVGLLMACLRSQAAHAEFIPVRIETGPLVSCALSAEGEVKCWGANNNYYLATGDYFPHGYDPYSMGVHLPSAKLGTDVIAKDLCVGTRFACASTTKGKVKCWGENGIFGHIYGTLGQGGSHNYTSKSGDELPYTDLGSEFYAERVSCGAYHACATSPSGQTKCWGHNYSGELGIGGTTDRGISADQMGSRLPVLASSKPIRSIAPAASHTCALIENQVKCWGSGWFGQHGYEHSATLIESNIGSLPPVSIVAPNENIKIRKLSSQEYSTCVLYRINDQDVDHVKCWGDNKYGTLGIGGTSSHGNAASSMGANLPEVKTGFDHIADIQVHNDSVCVLDTTGKVKCWGYNEQGQLGLGHTNHVGSSLSEMGENLPVVNLGLPAKLISRGYANHNCAILINNYIKCWGENSSGQLGLEDGMSRGTFPNQMGDFLPFVRLN